MKRCALIAISLLLPSAVWAQAWPEKPVRTIVPFPAGGPLDVLARLFNDRFAAALGQPFIIDNRAGANGNLGGEAVARAAPDGHTLLWVIDTPMTLNPSLYAKMPFDPAKDLAPISQVATTASVLVVHPSVAAASVAELVALSKKRPLNYASGGGGSPGHLATELFALQAGAPMTHVPYKGNAPAVVSIVAGETQVFVSGITGVLPHIKAGKVKALAVTSAKRAPSLPDLPTFAEAGVPGVEVEAWFGLYAPAGTPRAVVDRLHREVVAAAKLPDVQQRLAGFAIVPVAGTPEQLAAVMQSDARKWAKVVKEAKITVD